MKKLLSLLTFLALLCSLGSCGKPVSRSPDGAAPVVVASMIDSEGALLGKMLILILENAGIKTVDKTEFGTPDILRKALEAGELDLVIDYTGSGQYYHEGQDPAVWNHPEKGYEMTRKLDRERKNIFWLSPAKANNTEMLAVRKEFSVQNRLADMHDLAHYINRGGSVKLICAAGFAENRLGLRGYEQAYGFKLRNDQLVILASGNTAEMLKALANRTDGINVSLVYGTDGALDKMNLVVLKDPKNIPPVYRPAPVVRGEVLKRYPEMERLFKPVFDSLSLETLQKLNARIAFDGHAAGDVAREYLTEKGFLKN